MGESRKGEEEDQHVARSHEGTPSINKERERHTQRETERERERGHYYSALIPHFFLPQMTTPGSG